MTGALISVVMPVFNGENYLAEAILSIQHQTFPDWQMVCVNDGSTDQSGRILDWFAAGDSRIKVLHQSNKGIVAALNAAWRSVDSPLIARMDCDDIAFPTRLADQLHFLEQHPRTVAIGGAAIEIDASGDPLRITRLPSDPTTIEQRLLHREAGLIHPSTLIRTSAMRAVEGYRSEYQWVEDHDLWLRLALRGELRNLDSVVLAYRQHSSSVCWQRSDKQRETMNALLDDAYSMRGLACPDKLKLSSSLRRSPGGPGKWARMASRGGFFKTAFKHLRQQWRIAPRSVYTFRMTAETLLRCIFTAPKMLFSSALPAMPSYKYEADQVMTHLRSTKGTQRRAA